MDSQIQEDEVDGQIVCVGKFEQIFEIRWKTRGEETTQET
jgi:hypothetical protein